MTFPPKNFPWLHLPVPLLLPLPHLPNHGLMQGQFKLEFPVQNHKCDHSRVAIMEVASTQLLLWPFIFIAGWAWRQLLAPWTCSAPAVPTIGFPGRASRGQRRELVEHFGSWVLCWFCLDSESWRVLILLTPPPPPGSWEPGNCWWRRISQISL